MEPRSILLLLGGEEPDGGSGLMSDGFTCVFDTPTAKAGRFSLQPRPLPGAGVFHRVHERLTSCACPAATFLGTADKALACPAPRLVEPGESDAKHAHEQ